MIAVLLMPAGVLKVEMVAAAVFVLVSEAVLLAVACTNLQFSFD